MSDSLYSIRDVRTPADPRDQQTTDARTALPPIEFRVTKGVATNTFYITDRTAVANRAPTDSYRIYFLPIAFASASTISDPNIRQAGQRIASIVTEIPAPSRGTVLTVTDTQFFGQSGWYYCVGVNRVGIEAPAKNVVASP